MDQVAFDAYCYTYGYIDGCPEPVLIQDSKLITSEILEKFNNHSYINL